MDVRNGTVQGTLRQTNHLYMIRVGWSHMRGNLSRRVTFNLDTIKVFSHSLCIPLTTSKGNDKAAQCCSTLLLSKEGPGMHLQAQSSLRWMYV